MNAPQQRPKALSYAWFDKRGTGTTLRVIRYCSEKHERYDGCDLDLLKQFKGEGDTLNNLFNGHDITHS